MSYDGDTWCMDSTLEELKISDWNRISVLDSADKVYNIYHYEGNLNHWLNQTRYLNITFYVSLILANLQQLTLVPFWRQKCWNVQSNLNLKCWNPRGATRMARGGIRLVHGHTKSTLITYFSGMKIDPKYTFLHAFFLICPSCPFQNLSIWPKTHPFFQFCTVLHP